MRIRPNRRAQLTCSPVLFVLFCLAIGFAANSARAQERRDREPNSVYAARRARLASQIDSPIILWGLTGREESAQTYIFAQEENFYYLTGHNEEGAGLIILPAKSSAGDASTGPRECLFLPAKNPQKEKWNGVRMSPVDPGIEARTGFSSVKPYAEMRAAVENLAKTYPSFFTILPYEKELGGYPHEKEVVDWLQQAAPQSKVQDIRAQIDALRQIKSPGEIAFLQRAIDLTLDSHLEAMRMMREVYASDRYFTFPRFHATAEYLKKKMAEAGLGSVELVETPADGVTQVGYWTMPLAWDVRSARLDRFPHGRRA